ncbi:hypothetical protein [Alteromonas sp. CYL-A6]|uniref:hypothetical protein n=1 Tax=Alteromonas nitratireducens TaxID=3390813 RepID=UPI0034B72FCE
MHALLMEIALTGSMVFIASALLHYLAYQKGLLRDREVSTQQHIQTEAISDKQKKQVAHPLIRKWLTFGGGYYGIIAFVRLISIEASQGWELVTNWPGTDAFTRGSGLNSLIHLFVSFLVEQFKTFAQAISWPAHYVSTFPIGQCALFIVATYLLFIGARQVAWRWYLRGEG